MTRVRCSWARQRPPGRVPQESSGKLLILPDRRRPPVGYYAMELLTRRQVLTRRFLRLYLTIMAARVGVLTLLVGVDGLLSVRAKAWVCSIAPSRARAARKRMPCSLLNYPPIHMESQIRAMLIRFMTPRTIMALTKARMATELQIPGTPTASQIQGTLIHFLRGHIRVVAANIPLVALMHRPDERPRPVARALR